MGEEVVYYDNDKLICGMNYYGITYDDALGEPAMDSSISHVALFIKSILY